VFESVVNIRKRTLWRGVAQPAEHLDFVQKVHGTFPSKIKE
jgi:hypothetical protein